MNKELDSLSNNDLYKKLECFLNTKLNELKYEIKTVNKALTNFESKLAILENKSLLLDRKIRKNNIVIFGLKTEKSTGLLEEVLQKLNEILGIKLVENDVNNVYRIGNKSTIIVEFISYLRKQLVFQNIRKLKNSGVSISNDLSPEDRETSKILYKNLKVAKSRNHKAYIKNYRLYVDEKVYTAEQLIKSSKEESNERSSSYIVELEVKSNSAPPTPSIIESGINEVFQNEDSQLVTIFNSSDNTIQVKPNLESTYGTPIQLASGKCTTPKGHTGKIETKEKKPLVNSDTNRTRRFTRKNSK